jgi:hypothetical protein
LAFDVPLEVLPVLRVQLQAQGLTPLVRDRFLLANRAVHEPKTLELRAGLGIGMQLW